MEVDKVIITNMRALREKYGAAMPRIEKAVKRQLEAAEGVPVMHLKALTHNVFDYSSEGDFRRETLLGMLEAVRAICQRFEAELVPATTAEIAAEYRRLVPLPREGEKLELDTRGRAEAVTSPGAPA